MVDRQGAAQSGEALLELLSVVRADVLRLAPAADDVVVQEVGHPPTVEGRDGPHLHPFGEGVDRDQQVPVPVGVWGEGSGGIDAPSEEGGLPFLDEAQLLAWLGGGTVLLAGEAMADAFIGVRL